MLLGREIQVYCKLGYFCPWLIFVHTHGVRAKLKTNRNFIHSIDPVQKLNRLLYKHFVRRNIYLDLQYFNVWFNQKIIYRPLCVEQWRNNQRPHVSVLSVTTSVESLNRWLQDVPSFDSSRYHWILWLPGWTMYVKRNKSSVLKR